MPQFQKERGDLVTRYHDLFLRHKPESYALMLPAGSTAKYKKQLDPTSRIPRLLTMEDLAAHLQGALTIAFPLTGAGELAYIAAADIDEDGDRRLWAMLQAAERRRLAAFAIGCPGANDHNGGHVWLLFNDLTNPERLRKLINQLALEASAILAIKDGKAPEAATPFEVEAYPNRKALRGPFGKHTWTQQRGRLLLQSGQVIDLDAGRSAIEVALAAIAALPPNDVQLLPPPDPPKPSRGSPDGPGGLSGEGDIVAEFNQETDLIGLLESQGAEIAEALSSGGYLLHCPCGRHAHGDRRASLELAPARKPERFGRFVAYGYSPACAFKTERGQIVDAFHVYSYFRQQPAKTLIEELRSQLQPSPAANIDAEPPAAADPNTVLLERAELDSEIQDCARQVLKALVDFARGRPSCRPSIQRLTNMTGLVDRTIYRGLQQLEGRYITSEPVHGHTTIRHFKRVEESNEDPPEEGSQGGQQGGGSPQLSGSPSAPPSSGSPPLAARSPQLSGVPTGRRSGIHGCEIHGPSCESSCEIRPCKAPPDQHPQSVKKGESDRFRSTTPYSPPSATTIRSFSGHIDGDQCAPAATTIQERNVTLSRNFTSEPRDHLISPGAGAASKDATDLLQLWQTVLDDLRYQVVRTDYDLGLRPTTLITIRDGVAVIGAPSRAVKELVESKHVGPIRRTLSGILGSQVQVQVRLQGEGRIYQGAPAGTPWPSAPFRGDLEVRAQKIPYGKDSRETGHFEGSAERPSWIPAELWPTLPTMFRVGLHGARLVGDRIEAATPHLTTALYRYHKDAIAALLQVLAGEPELFAGKHEDQPEASTARPTDQATPPLATTVEVHTEDRAAAEDLATAPASSPPLLLAEQASPRASQDTRKIRGRVKKRLGYRSQRRPLATTTEEATTQLATTVDASPEDRAASQTIATSPASSPDAAPGRQLPAVEIPPNEQPAPAGQVLSPSAPAPLTEERPVRDLEAPERGESVRKTVRNTVSDTLTLSSHGLAHTSSHGLEGEGERLVLTRRCRGASPFGLQEALRAAPAVHSCQARSDPTTTTRPPGAAARRSPRLPWLNPAGWAGYFAVVPPTKLTPTAAAVISHTRTGLRRPAPSVHASRACCGPRADRPRPSTRGGAASVAATIEGWIIPAGWWTLFGRCDLAGDLCLAAAPASAWSAQPCGPASHGLAAPGSQTLRAAQHFGPDAAAKRLEALWWRGSG